MTMTDPIADMLTRIRNAQRASHESVDIPSSKMKVNIAMKYDEQGRPVIEGLKRISKPSRKVYAGYDEIPKVLNGFGISIVSTSKGIMADKKARKMKVGGEILCAVW